MKNIMFLIGNLNNGGAEKSITKLANELSKNNNCFLVVASKEKIDYKPSIPVIEIPELTKKTTKIKGILKVKKLKKQLKINTSISYTTVFNFINVLSKYKDKTIISIRNYLSEKEKQPIYKILHKISTKKANIVVCCSKAVKYDQIKNYKTNKNKLVVIENFCNPKEINKLSKEKININKDYIMTTSRLEKHKGLIELINAFKIVSKIHPNLQLLIFGRGPLKNKLETLIKENKLTNKVILKGFTNNPYKYLKKAKCFTLTSYYEGFSNSLIEAMACSCPVLATDSKGGNREIITNTYYGETTNKKITKYGILLKTNTPKEIAKGINEILNNYEYYSKLSYKKSKDFNQDKIIRKWYEIL